MISEELSINKDAVWSIITENLEMRKVCAKMVPKLLSEDQKQQRVNVCQDIIERLEDDPDLLGRVITGDELVNIRIRSRGQTAEWSVEKSGITKTKESKDVEVEGQGDVHHVF